MLEEDILLRRVLKLLCCVNVVVVFCFVVFDFSEHNRFCFLRVSSSSSSYHTATR